MARINLRFVATADEMLKVARFRYSVYVEEMNRPQARADEDRRLIIDDLDLGSYVLGAWSGPEVIGTVRVNLCGTTNVGMYADWYNAPQLAGKAWPAKTAILTRLMVSPTHRGSLLGVRLATAVFRLGLSLGVECALMDCNEHLLPFFAQFGWRLAGGFLHPDYGQVFTHSMDLTDIAHLRRLNSPFLRALRSPLGLNSYKAVDPVDEWTLSQCRSSSVALALAANKLSHITPSRAAA